MKKSSKQIIRMHVILQLRIALWLLLTAAYAKSVVREESPQTVEDQEIINSYGGLDNTPSYLVRLRPTLTISKERIIVAKDGLPMGKIIISSLILSLRTERKASQIPT